MTKNNTGAMPAPPDPYETAATEAQFNRVDTYGADGGGVLQGYTDASGNFVQGVAPEGMQSAQKAVESPFMAQIRQLLQPGATSLAGRLVDQNINNLPDQAKVRDTSQVATDIFNRNFSLMQPGIDQANSRLIKNLQARGIPVGADAFNEAYGDQQTRTQDTISRLSQDATIAAGQEQSRLFALDSAPRQQAMAELAALFGGNFQPQSMMPSGNVSGVNYGGLVGQNYGAQMGAYQANQGMKMATATTLGTLGSALLKCSRDLKTVVGQVNPAVAGRIMAHMPLYQWRYTPESGEGQEHHIGPMAEDFQAMTGLGQPQAIHVVDYLGLLAGALQNALHRIEVLERQVELGDRGVN
jgi:hypothetical protein